MKDLEIAKMKEKTSDKAQDGLKDELRRAYEVLRHLKKKVGSHAFNEEYGVVIAEIRQVLQMPPLENKRARRKKLLSQEEQTKAANASKKKEKQRVAEDEDGSD